MGFSKDFYYKCYLVGEFVYIGTFLRLVFTIRDKILNYFILFFIY